MNISDRIQNLRKTKGISQEQLADVLGVSRQAVSKWESEQSTPDIEKIITMSDYFEVTTDYLLKGIEPITEHNKRKVNLNATIFSIVASAINILGVIVGALTWYDSQDMIAYAGMYILIILGIMLWGIGLVICDPKTRGTSIKVFAAVNVWILSFTPLSLIYNICTGGKLLAPYPIHIGAMRYYLLFWFGYILVGIMGEIIIFGKKSANNGGNTL